MRMLLCVIVVWLSAAPARTADLGSPVPVGPEPTAPPGADKPADRKPPGTPPAVCPCRDNGACPAGVCPTRPVTQAAVPVTPVTYHQVWVRRVGWVWVPEAPTVSAANGSGGTCSGDTCPLNR